MSNTRDVCVLLDRSRKSYNKSAPTRRPRKPTRCWRGRSTNTPDCCSRWRSLRSTRCIGRIICKTKFLKKHTTSPRRRHNSNTQKTEYAISGRQARLYNNIIIPLSLSPSKNDSVTPTQ